MYNGLLYLTFWTGPFLILGSVIYFDDIFLFRAELLISWIFGDIFSYFSSETICCEPSSEPSLRDGSDEGPYHVVFFCFFLQNQQKLSPIITKYSLLSRALLLRFLILPFDKDRKVHYA